MLLCGLETSFIQPKVNFAFNLKLMVPDGGRVENTGCLRYTPRNTTVPEECLSIVESVSMFNNPASKLLIDADKKASFGLFSLLTL